MKDGKVSSLWTCAYLGFQLSIFKLNLCASLKNFASISEDDFGSRFVHGIEGAEIADLLTGNHGEGLDPGRRLVGVSFWSFPPNAYFCSWGRMWFFVKQGLMVHVVAVVGQLQVVDHMMASGPKILSNPVGEELLFCIAGLFLVLGRHVAELELLSGLGPGVRTCIPEVRDGFKGQFAFADCVIVAVEAIVLQKSDDLFLGGKYLQGKAKEEEVKYQLFQAKVHWLR